MVHKGAYESKHGQGIKVLTLKKMLQRLPLAHAHVKTANTSENLLLNEIRQMIHSLYWEKEMTKKVYNNVMYSIKLWNRMDTIFMFMNSKNSRTSETITQSYR